LYDNKLLAKSVEFAREFINGLAPIVVSGKWGLIDYTGKFVVEPKFNSIVRPIEVHSIFEKKGHYSGFLYV
jgi:hypothetical protein